MTPSFPWPKSILPEAVFEAGALVAHFPLLCLFLPLFGSGFVCYPLDISED
jgi:hypothetical protein